MATSTCGRLRAGLTTRSAVESQAVAEALGREMPIDTILALHGPMGAGKTTWVQGLARGLGVVEPVTSPTFTLFNVHRGARARLIHFDAYRLADETQLDALMLEDFLITPWVLAIEWPERLGNWIPPSAWHFDLTITPDRHHTIKLR